MSTSEGDDDWEGDEEEDTTYTEEDLDEIYNDLSEEEQQAIMDEAPGAEEWDELSAEEKFALLQDAGHIEEDADISEDLETDDGGDDGLPGEGVVVGPGEGEVGLGFDDHQSEGFGGIEYVSDATPDADPVDMTIGNVHLRGVYEVEEKGAGFTEEYKAERERESGGQDEVDEPPAAELTIQAWAQEEDWNQLNAMRERRDPFPVSIGPFVFEEMGIANLEQKIEATHGPYARHIEILLKEFREVIVQRQSLEEALGGGGSAGGTPGEVQGPDPGSTSYDGTPVTVPSGQTETETVGSGETVGGELYDVSASGANVHFSANGSGWTIQDVGVTGTWDGRALDEGDAFINATVNGQCAIRHVFIGEGASQPRDTGIYSGGASGELLVERVNAQGWPDNAIYASEPNAPSNTEIRDCYAHNNRTSDYRLSNGLINNCVAVRDSANVSGLGGGARNVWAWSGGTVEVRDCDIMMAISGNAIDAGSKGGTVNVRGSSQVQGNVTGNVNGNYGSNPDPTNYHSQIPGGAADAASGRGGSGGSGGGDDGSESGGGEVV